MPAQSQQQQKLFGLALSVKRGETPRSEASRDVLNIVDTMSEKEIEDFASTSHKGLPPKVEEYIREEVRKHINENIPRMYKVYLGVQNKLRKLEDEQKKMLGQFKDEKDPKKKRNILDKMKDGTVRLKKVRANLADIEREYINKASYDTSYSENIKISKDDMEKLHSDGEVEVDGEKVTFEEGKKRFRQQDGIGKAKYTISYHDGKKKHKDGSDFFDIKIFKNKKDLSDFVGTLAKQGYKHESVNEASAINRLNSVQDAREKMASHISFKKAQILRKAGINKKDAWFDKQEKTLLKKSYRDLEKLYLKLGGKRLTIKESVNEGKYNYKVDALTAYFKGKIDAKELDRIARDDFKSGIATKKELSNFLSNKFTQDVMSDTYGIPAGTLIKRVRGLMKFAESVNEGVEPQIKKIAYFTGTRPEAVEDFVSKHALNITKLLKYVQKGGLPQRMELVSALAGRPNNPKQKKIIKQFQESINEVNTRLNKKVKSYLDAYLKGEKKNSPEHQHAIMLIMKGALTDANFHSEARQLDKFFPKAKQSKHVGTPMEDVIEDKGVDIAGWAKWDGYDIIDAFSFYTNMVIGGGFGKKLETLKESVVNEAKIKKVNKSKWNRMKFDDKVTALLSVVKDPDDAEEYAESNWEDLPSGFERDMVIYESVNEGISVSDERHFGKKGIIIMIDDNGKKISAIFKDKKNADKFNRNNPSDIKKLLQLAKGKKFPQAIDEEFKSKDSTFEKVYGIFDKRDYFNAKGLAKTQIGNFERALKKNDKGAQQILDKFKGDMGKSKEYIIQVISDQKKTQAYENYKALKMAVDSIQKGKPEQGAVGYVKRIIHNNNQKYSIALYSALRNQKFTKWKDIHNDIDSLIK
jgi:hypothetical protein